MRKMYSENQIKEMINEIVQQKATKIYKHTLTLKNSSDEEYTFIIQSIDFKNPVENLDNAMSLFISGFGIYESSGLYTAFVDYENYEIYTFANAQNNNLGQMTSVVSDEVISL